MPNNVTDFILYPETFHTIASERIAMQVNAFNGALTSGGSQSGGASVAGLTLTARTIMGNEEKHTSFKRIPGLIQERDPTSNAAVADVALEHLEHVGIKLNRRIGPIKGTLDQFRKIGQSPDVLSEQFGEQAGDAIFEDYINTALFAAVAAAELAGQGIRVNAVSPGPIGTPFWGKIGLPEDVLSGAAEAITAQTALKRFGTPEEVAKAVLFLASDDSSYMIGEEIAVHGGINAV